MHWRNLKQRGRPSLVIGPLRIWVHRREFPQAKDFMDGNWLLVTATCFSAGAEVRTGGPIIHLREVVELLWGLRELDRAQQGLAVLDCLEPELNVRLEMSSNGRVDLTVDIWPEPPLPEQHLIKATIPRSCLLQLVAQCEAVLAAYPVREPQRLGGGKYSH